LFSHLYNSFVKPYYPECEDYAERVLAVHSQGRDVYGYFTVAKRIWTFLDNQEPIGFTVTTEKRGGSIKFGPSVLAVPNRGHGLGLAFRLLVETHYSEARKYYNTLPEENASALKYVVKAGYRVEAHLQKQYRIQHGELVVGKIVRTTSLQHPAITIADMTSERLQLVDGENLSFGELRSAIVHLLSPWYDDIDDGFVEGVRSGMESGSDLSKKAKRVMVGYRSGIPTGIVVATPKRGGSLKCSPLIVARQDTESVRQLIESALLCFPDGQHRKVYSHIPLSAPWLIEGLSRLGFKPEGVLREPYKAGVDMIVFAKML
jgi:hypothetical protein